MIAKDLENLARPIGTLKSLPGNPRKGDVDAVARSYERFGQRKPIVATKDGTVIAGNHQLAAARKLGWSEIAVVVVDDDELTAKAFALADNRTADLGSYDNELLAELLADVAVDASLLGATGYNATDLDELIASLETPEPLIGDPDEIPVKAPAKTVRGDVWLLGEHRLMCGDSTVPTDVERLMAGKKADMVWTDPPYGVAVVGGAGAGGRDTPIQERRANGGKEIENDALNPEQLTNFLRLAFSNTITATKQGACWYVAAPPGNRFQCFSIPLTELKVWMHTLVWVKETFVMGRADYHYRHEAILYGWTPGAAHQTPPDRKQDTVWEIPRPKRNADHPTMKPVELITRAIENSSNKNQIIIDPFGGSGSTLIAAQETGRVCYTMELDPTYCDVICARFQKATGIMPIAEATGNPHDFLKGA